MSFITPTRSATLPEDLQERFHARAMKAQTRRRRLVLLWSYAPDWILCIVLVGLFYSLDYIEGFRREFDLTDTSIQHSFTVHERIPNRMLLIYAGAAPLVILPIVNLLTIRSWWDFHSSWLGLLLSLSLTGAVSQVVKVVVGRPRPDLIARCQPMAGATNNPVYGLVTSKICTQTDVAIMRDGFRSFPSAHSSLSFAGLGFLSFYLAGKLHLFDEKGYTGKSWVALTPLVGAALIAISRTMDYRHHWQDILTGSTIGIIFAFFAYRQYYPALSSALSHRPYSPRIPSERRLRREQVQRDLEGGRVATHDDSSQDDLTNRNGHHHIPVPHPRVEQTRQQNVQSHLTPPEGSNTRRENSRSSDVESYEMETTSMMSVDGTVKRPRQDLEQVWKQGGNDPQ
ncbi:hypothetical protein FRC19_009017 [Serendipita sp. 401]|nr:hypothetical protein FRC19_009017 [Serendipita sp. 401]